MRNKLQFLLLKHFRVVNFSFFIMIFIFSLICVEYSFLGMCIGSEKKNISKTSTNYTKNLLKSNQDTIQYLHVCLPFGIITKSVTSISYPPNPLYVGWCLWTRRICALSPTTTRSIKNTNLVDHEAIVDVEFFLYMKFGITTRSSNMHSKQNQSRYLLFYDITHHFRLTEMSKGRTKARQQNNINS